MKRNIKTKILACTALLAALLSFSCGDIQEDSSETVVKNVTNSEKAIISVSAEKGSSRTALPNYELADFDAFALKGYYKATKNETFPTDAILTKSWPESGSTNTAYSEMTAWSEEVDTGFWKFTLVGTKNGADYSAEIPSLEVTTTNPETKLGFNLSLASINTTGNGTVSLTVRAPANAWVVTAQLTDSDGTTIDNRAETELVSGSVTFSDVPGGYYIIKVRFYADAAKTLLIGTLPEYATVTANGTSSSTVSIDSLDTTYNIAYLDGATSISNLSPSKFTRFEKADLPTATTVIKTGSVFIGWYAENTLSTPVLSIPKGTLGDQTFYAKWIDAAETEDLTAVTITGDLNVGKTLSANLWSDTSASTAFGGSVKSYKWYRGDTNETSWTAIEGANASTYLVKAADGGKKIKVEVVRTYNKVELGESGNYVVTETGTTTTPVSGETTGTVAAGTLDTTTYAVTDLKYNNDIAVVVGSGLAASNLSSQSTTVKDSEGNDVSVTLGFASGATAPSETGTVAITLTAEGYTVATVTDAVTINVKAKAPTDEEDDTYRLSTLLEKEGAGTTESPYHIGKGYIRFASASTTLQYNVVGSAATDDDWKDVDTEEFVKPSDNKVYVRVKATSIVQASDTVTITVTDLNVGQQTKLVKVSLPEETVTPSVFKYGKIVTATPYSSEFNSNNELVYNELTSGVTYQWYYAASATETNWTSIDGATNASFIIEDSLDGTEYTTDLVGKYLKVVAIQENPNDATNPFKVSAISPVIHGTSLYSAAGAPSLVYAGGESIVIGQTLSATSITTSTGGAVDLTKLAVDTEGTSSTEHGVTVALKFAAGVAAPEGKSNVYVTAYAHGYADLEIPVLVTVRAAEPDTAKLSTWLSKDITAITYGYIKFTDTAEAAHLQYATKASPLDSDWTDVRATEVLKGDKLWLRVKTYTASGETDRSYGSDETLAVIASSAVDLTNSAYTETYTGTRSIKIISVTGDNNELGLTVDGLTVTATPTKAGDTINRWEVDGVTVASDWTLYGNTDIATVSTGEATNNTLTFNPEKITKTNGVTTARYQVTVYGTRTTTNGSVTLSTTLTVDVPLTSSNGN